MDNAADGWIRGIRWLGRYFRGLGGLGRLRRFGYIAQIFV